MITLNSTQQEIVNKINTGECFTFHPQSLIGREAQALRDAGLVQTMQDNDGILWYCPIDREQCEICGEPVDSDGNCHEYRYAISDGVTTTDESDIGCDSDDAPIDVVRAFVADYDRAGGDDDGDGNWIVGRIADARTGRTINFAWDDADGFEFPTQREYISY